MSPELRNPYWQELETLISHRRIALNPRTGMISAVEGGRADITALVLRYSSGISDPKVIEAVTGFVDHGVVETDTRNGYWSWLIAQQGKAAVPYGSASRLVYQQWARVNPVDRSRTMLRPHDQLTLLAVGGRQRLTAVAVEQYKGRKFVYIGREPDTGGDLEKALKGWTRVGDCQGWYINTRPYLAQLWVRGAQPERTGWHNTATQLMQQVVPTTYRSRNG